MIDISLKSISIVKKATEESVSNCRHLLELMNGDSDAAIEIILRFKSQGIKDFNAHLKDYYSNGPPLTIGRIKIAENKLGYKLPARYVNILKASNGLDFEHNCFPVNEETSWAKDHIFAHGLKGINLKSGLGLEETNTPEYFKEWGYPDIGILIGDTAASGHTVIMLDYRSCNSSGEPSVVFIDTERRHHTNKIVFLANSLDEFISGLVPNEYYMNTEPNF